MTGIAKELGLIEQMLRNWVKQECHLLDDEKPSEAQRAEINF
jgi:hypothetical protein